MDITFLGHAGMYIETRYGSILCDPLFNPVFFASWFPFPSNEQVNVRKIANPTYLYVSHLHYDHFDFKFLQEQVSKDAIVILPDFPLDYLERSFRKLGFTRFIQTENARMLNLNGLRITTIAMIAPNDGGIGDSGLIVNDNEVCIYDQNDSRPNNLDLVASFGPFDAHFLQYSGATWFPVAYQFPEKMMEVLGRKKRENQQARALRYAQELGASIIFPCAGPPCFLDNELFHLNDFDNDPTNMFPDQNVFLEYMQAHGMDNGHLLIPGSVATLEKGVCRIDHPLPEEEVQAIFTNKRVYLEAYQARQQPVIDGLKASWSHYEVDILSSMREWFEPLLAQANLLCVGVNGRVLFDFGEAAQSIIIDFQLRKVYAWQGEDWDFRYQFDPALVAYCILQHAEDWLNELFLSFRFKAQRKGPYNEYLSNFFVSLSPERINYTESYYARQPELQQLWESHGYRIQRYCPHMKGDLSRFATIEHGILTCSMHGWQFDLATGECLTTEGSRYHLFTEPLEAEKETMPTSEPDSAQIKQTEFIRTKCQECWYKPSELRSIATKKHL